LLKNAIVCRPCHELIHGITTSTLGQPVYDKAVEQHANYVKTLQQIGLNVLVLSEKDLSPDSTFIEDIALCTSSCAVITHPATASRHNEIIGTSVKFCQRITIQLKR
jgi:dimethylargininase